MNKYLNIIYALIIYFFYNIYIIMGKSKKNKKEASMIEDMTGIPSEYVWGILAVLCILIVVGCLYFFEIWPFAPEDTNLSPSLNKVLTPPGAPAPPSFQTPTASPPSFQTPTASPPSFQTPPTIPPDPAFSPKKVTGGGIQIFKKR